MKFRAQIGLARWGVLLIVVALVGCGDKEPDSPAEPPGAVDGSTADGSATDSSSAADVSGAAATDPPNAQESEEIVRAGIMKFNEGLASDDEAVRLATFDEFMPQEQHIHLLFGEGNGHTLWEVMQPALHRMRQSTDGFKKEVARTGPIVELKLIDVRTDDTGQQYEEVFQVIPQDIPVYRAITRYERGSGGGGSYIVLDGKMIFIRGLESLPKVLRQKKKG